MDEMRAYLGLLIFMGINKLPDYKLHWSKNKFLGNSGFIDVMPVRRYEKINQYLHCSSGNVDDPLCKIRPILDLVSENIAKSYKPRQHQTIDEGMIAYKGRHKVAADFKHKFTDIRGGIFFSSPDSSNELFWSSVVCPFVRPFVCL